MKKISHYDCLRQEWDAIGREIDHAPVLDDARLAELYRSSTRLPAVARPEQPSSYRHTVALWRGRTLAYAAVAALLLLLLSVPYATPCRPMRTVRIVWRSSMIFAGV